MWTKSWLARAVVTFATADGRVAQRSALTSGQKTILAALDLPEPPKYFRFHTRRPRRRHRLTYRPDHRRREVTRPKSAHPTFGLVNATIRPSVCPPSPEVGTEGCGSKMTRSMTLPRLGLASLDTTTPIATAGACRRSSPVACPPPWP